LADLPKKFHVKRDLCAGMLGFSRAAVKIRSPSLKLALEIVSNDRKMDLATCFGKPNPSHGTKMIAAFPGPGNFLNSRADPRELAKARAKLFGRQPAMAFAQDLDRPALSLDRLLHRIRIIGLVAKNVTSENSARGILSAWRIGDDGRN
jgi:hypothetical protein